MNDWTAVGTRDQVSPGWPLAAAAGTECVGVYEIYGALHAVENTCPHAAATLTEGYLEGCEIECPLHNAVFDVTTGKHLRGEPCRDLKRFAVRVVGARVEVMPG